MCPSAEQLERYNSAACSAAEATDIELHLRSCARCRAWSEEARADECVLGDVLRVLTRTPAPPADAQPRTPPTVGRYRLIQPIGEGGMGVVYEAEQASPHRRVALKLMRPMVLGARALRRFEYEGEILGRLHHPGIAQIYEAGTADTGYGPQPFFAMELITGRTLTESAAAGHWDLRRRLVTFVKICEAVHHAHQKGVIHRDLKPGNILIDEAGEPKILDFGVARVTDAGASTWTGVGQVVGTLPYMSPEQVGGNPAELDTRSDVYSLGIILYELLAGRLPHDLDRRPAADALRMIRDADVPRLGTIHRALRGDLETIVAQALAKTPGQRYPSAAAFAEDVERFLADEPVNARRQSRLYVLRKTIRRHREWFAVGTLSLLAVVAVALSASFAAAQRQTAILTLQAQAREREARLAAADARSLATSYYYEAVDLIRRGVRRAHALELLNGALEVDPTFAAARLERGVLCGLDKALRQGRPMSRFRPDLLAALRDFDLAHEFAGGDWLVDHHTARRLPPAEARALPADSHGHLLAFPDVRRLPDGSLVQIDTAGERTPVGGPGFPRALVAAGNLLAARLRQVPTGHWWDVILTELMDRYYERAAALDPTDVYTRLSPALAAAAKPAEQTKAARLLEALRDDAAAAGLFELWQALSEVYLGGPRRSFPEAHPERNPQAAEFAARQLTILAPRDEYGWYLLALARQEQGRCAEASAVIQHALSLLDETGAASLADPGEPGSRDTPTSGPLLTNLATCQALLGNFDAAWPLYMRAWERSGHSPLVLIERAEAYHLAGLPEAAACDLQDAILGTLAQPHLPVPAIGIPLAWSLLTFPDPKLRDPPTAREVLAKLCQRERWEEDATLQTLLAYAQVLCGEPQTVLGQLGPRALVERPSPFDAAVCSAAAQSLGLREQAEAWLGTAEARSRCLPYPDARLERLLRQVRRSAQETDVSAECGD